MYKVICTAMIGLASTCAMAMLVVKDPAAVCSMASEAGLKTTGWKSLYDPEHPDDPAFACSSPYKNIGSSSNNLAYFVEGKRVSATRAILVLNVNDPSTALLASQELQNAILILLPKISGEKSSEALKKAVTENTFMNTFVPVGDSNVSVMRRNLPTGIGNYQIKVIFE